MKKMFRATVFGILCFILTVAIVIQFKATSSKESASSQSRAIGKLKDQIIQLSDENTRMDKELQKTSVDLTNIRTIVSENSTGNKEKSDLIEKYDAFAGYTNVYGDGVSIVYTPAKQANISDIAMDVRYIINELKNVGVDAISVNGQRIVFTSAIEPVKNKIEVNGKVIEQPIKIEAIGNSGMINNGISRPGGIVDYIRLSGAKVDINQEKTITIDKYSNL